MSSVFIVPTHWGWPSTGHAPSFAQYIWPFQSYRSDWARATSRTYGEASIAKSPNRMFMQCSNPLYEPHLNVVATGMAKLDDEIPGIAALTTPAMRSPHLRRQVCKGEAERKRPLTSLK